MKRKLFSILTALALCLSLCPVGVLAAEGHPEPVEDDVASVTVDGTTTYYSTIEDAWAAAKGKTATVTLLGNVEPKDPLYIQANDNITFEGGDYTLTRPGTVFQYSNSSDNNGILTFASGTVVSTGTLLYGVRVSTVCTGTFIMTGGTIQAPCGIYLEARSSEATVKISGGTIIGSSYAIRTYNGATIGSLLDQGGASRVAFYKGETLVTEGLDDTTLYDAVTVKPCTHAGATATDNGDGTHTLTCPACGGVSTANHTWDENGSCVCGAQAVAQVRVNGVETYYTDIQAAFAAAQDSGIVELLADVTLPEGESLTVAKGKMLTLNCGEFTLSGSYGYVIQVSGTLHFLGGTLKNTGRGSVVSVDGTFTMSDGTLESVNPNEAAVGAMGGSNNKATVTIRGGSVGAGGRGLDIGTYTDVQLSGGTYGKIVAGAEIELIPGYSDITVPGLLADGYAFFRDGAPVPLTEKQHALDGPVTVAKCTHAGAEAADNGDGTHSIDCPYCGGSYSHDTVLKAEADQATSTVTLTGGCNEAGCNYAAELGKASFTFPKLTYGETGNVSVTWDAPVGYYVML